MNCINLLISSPVLLVLLVFAGHPPAVHGVVDAGLAQLVRRGHVQHEVQLVPALVDVAQVQSGEVCKNWILEEGDKQDKMLQRSDMGWFARIGFWCTWLPSDARNVRIGHLWSVRHFRLQLQKQVG